MLRDRDGSSITLVAAYGTGARRGVVRCRCGTSGSKPLCGEPLCGGAHAEVDFTAAECATTACK
ncbi:MAG: hypothetical protein L0H59_00030 [Tomitella sp.]|nr:hypothetical protein [Tomitella sp.]